MADIIATLSRDLAFELDSCQTRFPGFERAVLARYCRDRAEYDRVIACLQGRQEEANGDLDQWGDLHDYLVDDFGADPLQAPLGIPTEQLAKWFAKVTDSKALVNNAFGRLVRQAVGRGQLQHLRVPANGKIDRRTRGLIWSPSGVEEIDDQPLTVFLRTPEKATPCPVGPLK